MSEAEMVETAERRKCQRFVAKRRGEYCFFGVIDGQRLPLVDLSLDGFAIPAASPPPSDRSFEFVLQRTDVPDEISGRARVVNYLSSADGGQAGCLFDALDGDGRSRLEDWLTAHVLANASVPISEKDAARIVSGPSLV
jgi:hypothetical protein